MKELAEDILSIVIIVGVVALIVIALVAGLVAILPDSNDYLVYYEQSYAECMARESIDADYCHNIARVRTYGR